MTRFLGILSASLACFILTTGVADAVEGDHLVFASTGIETRRLVIHGATDVEAMRPLIEDFQTTMQGLTVEYVDYLTNDLFKQATAACAEERYTADLLMSSSVDQLVKLANDGCALSYSSATTEMAPGWANWREEIYGFTFEPSVIVYDDETVPPEDVPYTHEELADLLRKKPEAYKGRIGTYDIEASGIGYLLAYNDSRVAPTSYGRLLESLGRAETITRCCNNEVLGELLKGNIRIAYNILGSYAYAAHLQHPNLKIVLPKDYTLILSRGTFIPLKSREKDLAGAFIDYLLSPRGKQTAKQSSFFFADNAPLPKGVDGPTQLLESGIGRPIRIGPALLAAQDKSQRDTFISDWREVMRSNLVK